MVCVLWDRQVDAIIDVKLGYSNADMHKYEPMTSLLARWERSINTSTVSIVTTNGNIFRRLFFQWMGAYKREEQLSQVQG